MCRRFARLASKVGGVERHGVRTCLPQFSPQQVILDPVVPLEEHSRRSAWFSKDKNKDGKEKGKENGTHKTKEKKGLNPDAKEFSLSKDKERSFFASLRNKGSTTPNSGSGSSSTPSTAS